MLRGALGSGGDSTWPHGRNKGRRWPSGVGVLCVGYGWCSDGQGLSPGRGRRGITGRNAIYRAGDGDAAPQGAGTRAPGAGRTVGTTAPPWGAEGVGREGFQEGPGVRLVAQVFYRVTTLLMPQIWIVNNGLSSGFPPEFYFAFSEALRIEPEKSQCPPPRATGCPPAPPSVLLTCDWGRGTPTLRDL